jgi:hypothetical protein
MITLGRTLYLTRFPLDLLTRPRPDHCVLRHLSYLLVDLAEPLQVDYVSILQLLFQVSPHHVLLIFELVQGPCLILIYQLDGPLDALSRALHVLVNAKGCSCLTLAHLLHQHLSLEQLLVRFV